MRTERADIRRAPVPSSTFGQLTDGTAIGDMISYGGLAAAFDGTISQAAAACCGKASSSSGYNNAVGKSWGTGHTLQAVAVYGPNDASVLGNGTGTTFNVEGSDDGTTWTVLKSAETIGSGSNRVTVTAGLPNTSYRYHRANFSGNGFNSISIAEVQFYGR